MKNIRIDYYRFRMRKGRVDILLEKVENSNEYCVPYHFVRKNEFIRDIFSYHYAEDDGDLVLNDVALNDCHLSKKGKEWVSLKKVMDLTIVRNDSFHIWYNILRFFLHVCPREGESGNIKMAEEMLEDVLVRTAKKEYLDWLQGLLDGKRPVIFDAYVTPPDPELVRRELETLEHFQLYKPKEDPMTQRDYELQQRGRYSFMPVNLETFGCTIQRIPFNHLFEDEGNIETEVEVLNITFSGTRNHV